MKKIYNRPDIEVVKVAAVQLLDASIEVVGDYDDGEGITLGSRMFDDWDNSGSDSENDEW